jgi:hypothetical protein
VTGLEETVASGEGSGSSGDDGSDHSGSGDSDSGHEGSGGG